ncbi:MAG: VWA-like domain-containing protein [Lachnospiraceae bacterium]|nr:VWA-like domain-containing protein [Lachnospiraceae bacterium]
MGKIRFKPVLTPLKETKKQAAAKARIEAVLRKLKRENRFLVAAANFLTPVAVKENLGDHIVTDGKNLYFSPAAFLKDPDGDDAWIRKQLLHIMMHGFLGHFVMKESFEHRGLFWMVLDVQVMLLQYLMEGTHSDVQAVFEEMIGYELYFRSQEDGALYDALKRTMKCHRAELDDHSFWALPDPPGSAVSCTAGSAQEFWEQQIQFLTSGKSVFGRMDKATAAKLLTGLGKKLREGGRQWGTGAGNGKEMMEAAGEAKLFYRGILQKLSEHRESVREEDNIDPIYYSYGLSLYEDVPIIEPLEETETLCLRSVVIGIDTSGSCVSDLPQFLSETQEIFGEILRIGHLEKLHLLQCDDAIQSEQTIDSAEELAGYGKKAEMRGFGGTSFVPVFNRVKEYIKEGEKIDCLIYLSDGYGQFPTEVPPYPVYFVLKENSQGPGGIIPPWVRCLYLEQGERGKNHEYG